MHNPFDQGYYETPELRTFGFAHIGENVRIAKNCKIVGLSNIEIGDNSRIDDFTTLIASGRLYIGKRVHIHSYCQIGARGGVILEDFSSIASGCLVFSASDDLSGRHMVGGAVPTSCTKPKIAPVRLARHAILFARSTILPGVTLNEGAVACAHSLVSASVAPWTVVAGSPAIHRINRSRRLLDFESVIDEVSSLAA